MRRPLILEKGIHLLLCHSYRLTSHIISYMAWKQPSWMYNKYRRTQLLPLLHQGQNPLPILLMPLRATLDQCYLTLFGAIARMDPENPLRQVNIYQLVLKDTFSKNWFIYTCQLGKTYGINTHQGLLYP